MTNRSTVSSMLVPSHEAVPSTGRATPSARDPRARLALPGLTAALVAGAGLQGGFHPAQGAIVVALLAGTLVLSIRGARLDARVSRALCALAAGLGVATAASEDPLAAAPSVLVLASAALAASVGARAAGVDGPLAVLEAVVRTAALVAVVGIAGVALGDPRFALDASPWRLMSTFTYQNAAGAFLALAIAPAAVLASLRASRVDRLCLAAILTATVATLSRGALLGASVAVLVLLTTRVVRVRPLITSVAAALVGVGSLVPAMLSVKGGMTVALVGGACAASIAWVGEIKRSRLVAWSLPVASGGLVVVAAGTQIAGRMTIASGDRARVWFHTFAGAREHLVLGTGPGTFDLVAPLDGRAVRTAYAHNEYLQALSETGLVGIAAIVLAISLLGSALLRARPRAAEQADATSVALRGMWAAAVAAGAAFFVMSGLDFIWRFPVIVVVPFALLGAAARVKTDAVSAG